MYVEPRTERGARCRVRHDCDRSVCEQSARSGTTYVPPRWRVRVSTPSRRATYPPRWAWVRETTTVPPVRAVPRERQRRIDEYRPCGSIEDPGGSYRIESA